MNRITCIVFLNLLICLQSYCQGWKTLGPDDLNQPTYHRAKYISMALYDNEPFIVFADMENGNRVTVRKHTTEGWQYVGTPGFSAGVASYTDIAIDKTGVLYVAYRDEVKRGRITVKSYNGMIWQDVGTPGFSKTTVKYVSIALDGRNNPYVVYTDDLNNNKCFAKTFNGTAWVDVGPSGAVSLSGSDNPVLAFDAANVPYVAFWDVSVGYKATVRKFNGSVWTNVGSPGFSDNAFGEYMDLVVNSTSNPIVTYRNGASGTIAVRQFNGTSWVELGVSPNGLEPALALGNNDTLFQAYADYSGSGGALTIRKYDGTQWTTVGTTPYTQVTNISLGVAANNIPYLACNTYDQIGAVIRYDGISWQDVVTYGHNGSRASSPAVAMDRSGITYILCADYTAEGKATVRKYVGGEWIVVGSPAISNSAISLSSIYITNKDSIYIAFIDGYSGFRVKKFDGTDWRDIGDSAQIGPGEYLDIAVDANDVPYIVYSDFLARQAPTVKKFDGSNWVTVGLAGFEDNSVSYTKLAIDHDGIPYVVYRNNLGWLDAVAKKFNGISWVNVGSSASNFDDAYYTDIAINDNNEPYVVCNTERGTVVNKFDGSWRRLGGSVTTKALFPSIAIGSGNTPYVSYISTENGNRVFVKKYADGVWHMLDTVSRGYSYDVAMAVYDDTPVVAYLSSSNNVFVKSYNVPPVRIGQYGNDYSEWHLYPNPASDFVYILFHAKNTTGVVTLSNIFGQVIYEETLVDASIQTFSISHLPSGLYIATIYTAEGHMSKKFIKQ